jgi:hypothetical protein
MFRLVAFSVALVGCTFGVAIAQASAATAATVCCTNTACSGGGCWQASGKHCVYASATSCATHNCLPSDECAPM